MYVPFVAEPRIRRQDDSKDELLDREEKHADVDLVQLNARAITLANELERVQQRLQRVRPRDDFVRQQQAALDQFHPPARSVGHSPMRGLLPELDAVGINNQQHGSHISASSLLNPLMSPLRTPHQPPQRDNPAQPSFLPPVAGQPLPIDNALLPLITSLASAFERVGDAPVQATEMNTLKILGASAFTDRFTGASYLMKLEGLKKSSPGSPDNYFVPVKLIASINPPPSGCNSANAISTRADKFVSKAEWNLVVTSILRANFGIGSTDVSAIYDRPTVVTSTGESIEDYSNRFHQASAVCCWAALLTFPNTDYRNEHFKDGPPAVHLQSYIQGLPAAVKTHVQLAIHLNDKLLNDYTLLRRFTIETAKNSAPPGFQPLPPPLPFAGVDPAMIAMDGVICYSCNQPGHYANACPSGNTGNKGSYGKGKGNGSGGRGKGKGSYGNNTYGAPCRNFANGACHRGDTCRYTHVDGNAGTRYDSPNQRRYTDNNNGSNRYTRGHNYHQRDGDRNINGKRGRARTPSPPRDRNLRTDAANTAGSLNG